ncbi:MAG: tetratricopeptide repeat protein [Clostridium sp.]|nr:tetratricopeptide repeat protein [Clostridium sp.]
MKKVVLLITILFVSVISTACINNLAVQELNNKAKEYMANGETEKAICRLRSSIDLDTSIFETHYNLGVALIEVKEYAEAQASLENAIKLKPDFADSYYSLAMAMENQADDIINGRTNEDKTLNSEQTEETAQQADAKAKKELTEAEKNKVIELLNGAVDNYNKYIVKKPDAEDKDKVEEQIRFVNEQIGQYNSLRSNAMPDVENASTSTNLEGSED